MNHCCRLRWLLIILMAGCTTAGPRRACLSHDNTSPAPRATVVLALSLLTPFTVEIPSSGTTLRELLAEHELISVAVTSAIRTATAPALAPRWPDIHPNVLVHVRGQTWTAFPRALLFHPVAQNLMLRDGDQIYTFEWSRFKDLFIEREGSVPPPPVFPINVLRTGILCDPESRQSIAIDESGLPSNGAVAKDLFSTGHIVDASSSAGAIVVLHRQRGPMIMRFICPLRETGFFSQNGNLIRAISGDGNNGLWNTLFGKYMYDLKLQSGDVIEFTLLEQTSPFNAAE